jgi:hypothetical protein
MKKAIQAWMAFHDYDIYFKNVLPEQEFDIITR